MKEGSVMKKFTFDFVKDSIESEGSKLLTDEYKNSSTKMITICPRGHTYKVSFFDWRRGRRCKDCFHYSKRKNIKDIRASFKNEGYTLLTNTYKNNLQYLDYICPNGHKGHIRWLNWNQGEKCKECHIESVRDVDIEYVREEFDKEGYILLSDIYKSCTDKLNFICPKGHNHSISWISWKSGCRCGRCKGNIRVDTEDVRIAAMKRGYKLKSEYSNKDKLMFECPEGHTFRMTWGNFRNGQQCPICYKKDRKEKALKYLKGFDLYKQLVLMETKVNYRKHKDVINPHNIKRNRYYHLDHKYSIVEGFKHNILPNVIGSYVNLEVIPVRSNIQKGTDCSITKEELFNKWLTTTTNR